MGLIVAGTEGLWAQNAEDCGTARTSADHPIIYHATLVSTRSDIVELHDVHGPNAATETAADIGVKPTILVVDVFSYKYTISDGDWVLNDSKVKRTAYPDGASNVKLQPLP